MLRAEGDGVAAAEADGVEDGVEEREQSWDNLADAPLEFDPNDPVCAPCDDEVAGSDGGHFQFPQGAFSPKAPSKEAQARHNLTSQWISSRNAVQGRSYKLLKQL